MEGSGKIYKAIPEIMGSIGAIGKSKVNVQQKFNYRGVDDVMNALGPAMAKAGVFVVPDVLEQSREDRASRSGGALVYAVLRVRFSFYADDGSHVDAVTVGEGMDSGDKASNKAMSAAFKYACFQTFCIPTDEIKDPDAESHEVAPRGTQRAANYQGGVNAQGSANGAQAANNARYGSQPAQGGRRADTPEDARRREENAAAEAAKPIRPVDAKALADKAAQKGVAMAAILRNYNVASAEALNFGQWMEAMKLLDKYKDKDAGAGGAM